MGNIQTQTFKGSITSYLGLIIGYIYMVLILPQHISTDQLGLVKLLASLTAIFGEFATLGFNSVTIRLFPYFRDEKNRHNGMLLVGLLFVAVGVVLVLLGYLFFKPHLIEHYSDKSALFAEYIYLLVPLVLFRALYAIFDIYLSRSVFDSVTGTFWLDFGFKSMNMVMILLMVFGVLTFHGFIIGYACALAFPAIPLLVKIINKHQMPRRINLVMFRGRFRKELFSIAGYGIVSGLGGVAVLNIDALMINHMLGLNAVGIYGVCAMFSTIIKIPYNSLTKAASPVISEAWKADDREKIKRIYYKSSLNQLILGSLLLIGIWGNIDNVFRLLPSNFLEGKYVILLVAFGILYSTSTGASIQLISTSTKYKVLTYFTGVLLIATIVFNLIFIPIWGINGAALATMLAYVVNASVRVIYIGLRMKMWPYSFRHIAVVTLAIAALAPTYFLPYLGNFYVDLIVRSGIISVVFVSGVLLFKISEDINELVGSVIKKVFG